MPSTGRSSCGSEGDVQNDAALVAGRLAYTNVEMFARNWEMGAERTLVMLQYAYLRCANS